MRLGGGLMMSTPRELNFIGDRVLGDSLSWNHFMAEFMGQMCFDSFYNMLRVCARYVGIVNGV